MTVFSREVRRVPRVPLLPSSESKANVGCYEYHFSMKGIDKRCFLVVQVVLVGKECMKGTDPKNVKGKKKFKRSLNFNLTFSKYFLLALS